MHQQADEQQQKAAGEGDEPHLLRWQALLFKAGVGLGQKRGDIQPFAWRHLDLGDQHGRIYRFQGQRVMGPGAWQFIELEAGIENPQVFRADESHRNVRVLAQGLTQHFVHGFDHCRLARGDRQHLHTQRSIVERHHEPGAAHAAQLVEHQRPERHRQGAEITDTGGHGMGKAAGAGDQTFQLGGAQLRDPDHAGQRLREQHREQGQQQHAPEQRARHRHFRHERAKKISDHCWQPQWLPVGSHCHARYGSGVAVFRCRAGVGADG